jgi:mRNA-degrading endonuclease toxin of MazEF toxin-antitoxin module
MSTSVKATRARCRVTLRPTRQPRPVAIVQDDRFSETDSITVCLMTSDAASMPLFRIAVDPSDANGLTGVSRLMSDKITPPCRENASAAVSAGSMTRPCCGSTAR